MEWLIAIVSEFLVAGLFEAVKDKAAATKSETLRRKLLALSRETLEEKVTRAASEALSDFHPTLPGKLKAPVSAFFQQTLRGELPKLFRSGQAIDWQGLQGDLERWLAAKAPDVDAGSIAAELMPRVLSAFEFAVARDPVLRYLRLSNRLSNIEGLIVALPLKLGVEMVETLPKAVVEEIRKTLPDEVADAIQRRQAEKGQEDFAEAERRYVEFVKDRAATMTFTGMPIPPRSDVKPPRTDQMYVALKLARPARVPYDEAGVQVEEPPGRRRAREGGPRETALERPVEIGEAMRRHRNLVILGKPGSGKSTIAKYIALAFAKGVAKRRLKLDERRLPVLVELRDFAARLPAGDTMPISLTGFLAEQAERHDCSVPKAFFKRHRESGDCIVLLDGLDEVRDEKDRRRVANSVSNFLRGCGSNVRVVVTSRVTGYRPDFVAGSQFEEFEVQDFTIGEEVPEFVRKWYALVEKVVPDPSDRAATPQRLVDTIKKTPGIHRLATNPLLLTLIALIDRGGRGALPRKRVKLYERCTEALLSTWMRAKGLEPYVDEDEARERLEPLALWMHRSPARQEARYDEVVEQVAQGLVERKRFEGLPEARHDARSFLRDMRERAGLLVESGVGVWGFMHLTFQEYFAACALHKIGSIEFSKTVEAVMEHVGDPAWEETIRLVCGLCTEDQVEALVGWVLDQEDDVFHSNLFLAAKCLADATSGETPLTKRVEDALSGLYWQSDLRPEQVWALEAMSLSRRPSSVSRFAAALKEKDSAVRGRAAEAVGKIGGPEGVQHLIGALKDEDSAVRGRAALALGNIGAPEGVQHLIAALKDEDSDVRGLAAQALGNIGDPEGVQHLIAALKDEESFVRGLAAFALGNIGAPEGVQHLIAALKDEDSLVRWHAALALGKIGTPEGVQRLIEALKDEDWVVRGLAAEALGNIGGPEGVQHLIAALKDEASFVRRNAAGALGKIGGPEGVQHLSAALKDEDSYVRGRAALALGNIGGPEGVQHLIAALKAGDLYVRGRAALALGNIGAPEGIQHLIRALNDEGSFVRGNAAKALGNIGAPEGVRHLIAALKDEDSNVREAAYGALKKVSDGTGLRIYPRDVPGWPRPWEASGQLSVVSSQKKRAKAKAGKTSVVSSQKKSTKAKESKKK